MAVTMINVSNTVDPLYNGHFGTDFFACNAEIFLTEK